MVDNKHEKVLIVRHLPSTLSKTEKEDLLKYFGAYEVRVMPDKGRMKNTAFASFRNEIAAQGAITRLHQVEILNCVLSVEYARASHLNLASKDNFNNENEEEEDESKKDEEKIQRKIEIQKSRKYTDTLPAIAPHFGLKYPANPGIRYKYPPANPDILINICSALLTVPRLYTQVLHLMNKMNLLPPFTAATSVPPMLVDHIRLFYNLRYRAEEKHSSVISNETSDKPDLLDVVEMSESESEYESGDSEDHSKLLDVDVPERVLKSRKRKIKLSNIEGKRRRRLLQMSSTEEAKTLTQEATDIKEVFDSNTTTLSKKDIQMKVPINIIPDLPTSNITVDNTSLPSIPEHTEVGFGKFNPINETDKTIQKDFKEGEESILKDYITEKQLAAGRISSREMSSSSVFKNYHRGEATCRLYIKNLSKRVTEKDLKFIYGRFVDFKNQTEENMFDVRLMTQGRMKGQAFVGMPSVDAARDALRATNGYKLIDKPMVVQFARSAKPK